MSQRMPKLPVLSLLAAMAVISSFSVAAMAEEVDAVVETQTHSAGATHTEKSTTTPTGHAVSTHSASHNTSAHVATPIDADDMTVDDEE